MVIPATGSGFPLRSGIAVVSEPALAFVFWLSQALELKIRPRRSKKGRAGDFIVNRFVDEYNVKKARWVIRPGWQCRFPT
jgi:hypothetical protein